MKLSRASTLPQKPKPLGTYGSELARDFMHEAVACEHAPTKAETARYLWERACSRRNARPVAFAGTKTNNPLRRDDLFDHLGYRSQSAFNRAFSVNDSLEHIAALISQGRPDLACPLAEKARARFPDSLDAARLHGVALLSTGQVTAAITALKQALAIDDQSVETLCNLGSALLAADDSAGALQVLEAATKLAPNHAAARNGLGNARRAAGEIAGAREAYFAATRADPTHLGAWLNLAAAELATDDALACERIARMILKQVPHPRASLLLSQSLLAQNRATEALAACEHGLANAPQDPDLLMQLGHVADENKQLELAASAYRRALDVNADNAGALSQLVFIQRQLCDWNNLDALSQRLHEAVAQDLHNIAPFGFLAEPARADQQLRCAQNFAKRLLGRIDPMERDSPFPRRPMSTGPLRIGFASNGFGNHPTGLLTVAFFEALTTLDCEIHLFATTAGDGSPIQERLHAAATRWHELHGLSPRGMADAIALAQVDVLVDLRVWGGGNISEALALRPAPMQVNWLAYPGTSGAAWIDHVIADKIVLPDSMRAHFSEQVIWLPRCFQPSDPTRVVADPPPRSACGLPESGTVYVCFNNSYKLDARSMARIFQILRRVPDSVLWLLRGPTGSDENLRGIASSAGVDPQRLVFMDKLPHADYLARYRHADLFLDTAIYNAHTTASDAIWAGCPVLTTPGETFASRVAASLNHYLGMPELNVADDVAFVEFAVKVGLERDHRNNLHQRLAERRAQSGLFDMQAFARDFLVTFRGLVNLNRP